MPGPILRLYPQEITALLQGEQGPVYKDVARRTLKVHAEARRTSRVDTGRLRSSYRFAFIKRANSVVGVVGSDVDYAFYVEKRFETLLKALRKAST